MPADRHLSNVGESGVTQNTTSVYDLSGTAVDATYQTFGDSPAADAEDIWVRLNSEDSDKYEVGLFTFNTGTPNTLTRVSTVESSNADGAVDFLSESIEAVATVIPGQKMVSGDHAPFEELSSDPASPASGDRKLFAESTLGFRAFTSGGSSIGLEGASLIESQSPSGVASADFTGFLDSVYDRYIFMLENIVPATDDVNFQLRTSTDSGSTWDSSTGQYFYATQGISDAGTLQGAQSGSAAEVRIDGSTGIGSASEEAGYSGELAVHDPANTSLRTLITGRAGYVSSGGDTVAISGISGLRATAGDVNGVRFLFTSGNIESGEINLYGVKT